MTLKMSVVERPEPAPIMGTYQSDNLLEVANFLLEVAEEPKALVSPSIFDLRHAISGRHPMGSDKSVASLLAAAKPSLPLAIEEARKIDGGKASSGERSRERQQRGPRPLRHILLSGASISAFSGRISNFMSLLRAHPTLTSLDLQNSKFPLDGVSGEQFALTINTGVLRSINMPSFVGYTGATFVIDFVNSLDSSSLETLYLNKAIILASSESDSDEADHDELMLIARAPGHERSYERKEHQCVMSQREVQWRFGEALAHLVSPWHISGRGWAPNLKKLHLNASELGIKTVKRVTRSILGQDRKLTREGHISPPNQTLMSVEMLATYSDNSEEEFESEKEENHRPSSNLGSDVNLRRVRSISTALRERRIQTQSDIMPASTTSIAGDIIQVRSSIRRSSVRQEVVTKANWRRLLGNHLWKNRRMASETRELARSLLPAVRVLGCCSREAEASKITSSAGFPFARLPAELRRRIVDLIVDVRNDDGHSDDDNEKRLTRRQRENIISFACERSTIGYGSRSSQLGMSDLALSRLMSEVKKWSSREDVEGRCMQIRPDVGLGTAAEGEDEESSLIPRHRWSWLEMIRERSVPRDWPAAILDEAGIMTASAYHGPIDDEEATEAERTSFGGGGGPDGQGGITMMRPVKIARERKNQLWQTSGLRAFWEATGTTTSLAEGM